MASAEKMRDTVAAYVKSVGTGDTDAIVALFADDATVEDPHGTPVHRGHTGIREFYGMLSGAHMQTELVTIRIAGDSAAFELRVITTADGKTITIAPIDVMTFDEHGKITTMRAYWSGEDLLVE